MKFEEIIKELKSQEIDIYDFAQNECGEYITSDDGIKDYSRKLIKNIGIVREIQRAGGEGQGEDWYSVKYFPDHDIFIKVSGFYQSYNGLEFYDGWDSCKEVKPKEKVITVYESI